MKRKKKNKKVFGLTYINENKNPFQNETGDCAIRAISKFFNISWEKAYRMLFKTALKRKSIATNSQTIKMALIENGCSVSYCNTPLIDYVPKTTESVLLLAGKQNSDGHAIYVKNGAYYDTGIVDADYYNIMFEVIKEDKPNETEEENK